MYGMYPEQDMSIMCMHVANELQNICAAGGQQGLSLDAELITRHQSRHVHTQQAGASKTNTNKLCPKVQHHHIARYASTHTAIASTAGRYMTVMQGHMLA